MITNEDLAADALDQFVHIALIYDRVAVDIVRADRVAIRESICVLFGAMHGEAQGR